MWKPYTVIALYFIGKTFLLGIFWTSFSKNCQFLDNFDQNLCLVKYYKGINKNGLKYDFKKVFLTTFADTFTLLDQKQVWVKCVQKLTIFIK